MSRPSTATPRTWVTSREPFDEGPAEPPDDRGPSCRRCGSLVLEGETFCDECIDADLQD
jgi:hypothetical protein